MKNTDILSRINALLSKKIELEQQTLENGTVVEADSFEVGKPIFAINGDVKEPLEVGEYVLADGTKLYVTEIGLIGELATPETEVVEEEMSTETETETVVEQLAEVPPTLEEIVLACVDALEPKLAEMRAKIDELVGGQTAMKETLSSVSTSKPTTHKPNETKLSGILKKPSQMSVEELIFTKLASFNN